MSGTAVIPCARYAQSTSLNSRDGEIYLFFPVFLVYLFPPALPFSLQVHSHRVSRFSRSRAASRAAAARSEIMEIIAVNFEACLDAYGQFSALESSSKHHYSTYVHTLAGVRGCKNCFLTISKK